MFTTALKAVEVESEREMFVTRCCGCKRYRDSDGMWVKVIALPKNAVFTDGICVPCIKSLYPSEIAERVITRIIERGLA